MANTNLLDTKTVNLNEIFGNGKIYRVPQFQRDYSWDQDNWEDLWNDLLIANEANQPHYMGSIVLQTSIDKTFWIIDGQQRFTTISIVALALIKKVKDLADNGNETEANNERVDILMRQYVGHKDPASLKYSSKLFLNENNDGFYQQRLLNFREPINYRRLSDSEKLLWDAFKYYYSKINTFFTDTNKGEEIASFLNKIVGELLMFIQITVEDELNAYTVFETLNSRGVELTSTDLLKNYLFSLVAKSQSDLAQVKEQWKKVINTIGLKEFPTFLRYYLNTRRDLVTKDYLFKAIKNLVKSGQDVFDLLDHLESYAYVYVALDNSQDEFWEGDRELRDAVTALKLFRVTMYKPLALIAYEKLSSEDFKKTLRSLVAISFRYNVIGKLQTNEMETVYNKTALKVYSGVVKNTSTLLNELKNIYINDEEFRNYFELKSFNTKGTDKKIVRYILYNIEAQLSGGNKYDFEVDNGTIEHILPENPDENWYKNFTEEEFKRFIYLLGNLTLLEPIKNSREAAGKPMDEKVLIYASSEYKITQEIKNTEWNPKAIRYRQAHLAKIATSVWKIQFN